MYAKKSPKVLRAAVVSALALALGITASPASAAELTESSVINSGDGASVHVMSESMLDVAINNSNTATIEQSAHVMNNTGHNMMDGNIGGGSLSTGAALTELNFEASDVNRNTTSLSGLGGSGLTEHMVDVVNTGDDADVHSNILNSKKLKVSNTNTLNTTQHVNTTNNTGYNEQDGNLNGLHGMGGSGHVMTGEARTMYDLSAGGNMNTTAVGLGGSNAGVQGTESSFTNTGDDSRLHVMSESHSALNVSNANAATSMQSVTGHNNTGHNTSDGGVGGGSLWTGRAAFGGMFHSSFNENLTGIGAGWGVPMFYNLTDVVNTGDDARVKSHSSHMSKVSQTNTNSLSERQMLAVNNNSGYNHGDGSIGGGNTMTGQAVGMNEFTSAGNSNTSALGGITDLLALLFLRSN